MATTESEKIDKLRQELHEYHEEIVGLLTEHKICRREFADLTTVVYGNGAPGLKGQVASLIETRSNMRWGFGLIWSAVVAVTAAVIKVWWGKG